MNQSVNDEGGLAIGRGVRVPLDLVQFRVETAGGPGGQHANRAKTRVIVTLRLNELTSLSEAQRHRLIDVLGPVVRSSASRFRSQHQNREAALDQLAERLRAALVPPTQRRPTRPTASSRVQRVEAKRARSRLKQNRRVRDDQ